MPPYSSLVVSAPESGTASRISHRLRTASGHRWVFGFALTAKWPCCYWLHPGCRSSDIYRKALPATTGSISCQLVSFNSTLCRSATIEWNVLHKGAPPGLYGHSDLVRPQPLSTAHLVRASNTASQVHQRQKGKAKTTRQAHDKVVRVCQITNVMYLPPIRRAALIRT